MAKIRKQAYNANTTNFQFEGYLNKFITLKSIEEESDEKIIGVYLSFGPNRYGKVKFSTTDFKGDFSILQEGKPYRFTVNTSTNSGTTQLEYNYLIDAEPLDREPIRDFSNFVRAKVKKVYITTDRWQSQEVMVLEIESDNKIGCETYYCRYKAGNRDSWKCEGGYWNVELVFRQSPDLYLFDDTLNVYYIETEEEDIWVPMKDKEGNMIMETSADGEAKPKMQRKIIKTFVDTLRIVSLTEPE